MSFKKSFFVATALTATLSLQACSSTPEPTPAENFNAIAQTVETQGERVNTLPASYFPACKKASAQFGVGNFKGLPYIYDPIKSAQFSVEVSRKGSRGPEIAQKIALYNASYPTGQKISCIFDMSGTSPKPISSFNSTNNSVDLAVYRVAVAKAYVHFTGENVNKVLWSRGK